MRQQARMAAVCSMAAALGVVVMLLGSFLGLGMYLAPMLVGLCLAPVGRAWGTKYQLLLWIAVSLLCLMLVPDVEQVLMFAGFFGWYPAVRPKLEKLAPGLRWLVKIALFNGAVIALEAVVVLFLVPEKLGIVLGLVLLVLGNVTFVLYDRAIPFIEVILSSYMRRLRLK